MHEEWMIEKLSEHIGMINAQIARLEKELGEAKESWRCFHCGEVFTDAKCATLHFGKSLHSSPICQIEVERVRDMEDQLSSYRNEDTALTRQMATERMEHADNVRRAEESGYAKGLKDYTALETDRDTLRAKLANAQKEISSFDDEKQNAIRDYDLLKTKLAGAEKAVEWFEARAIHDAECMVNAFLFSVPKKCTCGLSALQSSLRKRKGKA